MTFKTCSLLASFNAFSVALLSDSPAFLYFVFNLLKLSFWGIGFPVFKLIASVWPNIIFFSSKLDNKVLFNCLTIAVWDAVAFPENIFTLSKNGMTESIWSSNLKAIFCALFKSPATKPLTDISFSKF